MKNESLYSTQTQAKSLHDLELIHSTLLNLVHESYHDLATFTPRVMWTKTSKLVN